MPLFRNSICNSVLAFWFSYVPLDLSALGRKYIILNWLHKSIVISFLVLFGYASRIPGPKAFEGKKIICEQVDIKMRKKEDKL